jgi:hypothetical protein
MDETGFHLEKRAKEFKGILLDYVVRVLRDQFCWPSHHFHKKNPNPSPFILISPHNLNLRLLSP